MTRLDNSRPSFMFSRDGGDKFNGNLGEIPFGSKVFNGMKREIGMLRTESEQI